MVLAGRGHHDLDQVLAEIGGHGRTAVVDVASEESVAALADEVGPRAVTAMLAMPGLCGADIDLSAGRIAR